MPELPEVQTIAQSIHDACLNLYVYHVQIHRPDVIKMPKTNTSKAQTSQKTSQVATRKPTQKALGQKLLLNGTIDQTMRHGKQMALIAQPGLMTKKTKKQPQHTQVLVIQLGMSGQVLLEPVTADDAPLPTHAHVVWYLAKPKDVQGVLENCPGQSPTSLQVIKQLHTVAQCRMIFRDPRRFGGLTPLQDLTELKLRWSQLGPDALLAEAEQLIAKLSRTNRSIKAALLDQKVIAGVGNIYADEALFLARIHPATCAKQLTRPQSKQLLKAIQQVLNKALHAGGSTLKDYRTPNGTVGGFQQKHAVYGRCGKICTHCSTLLQGIELAQRTTVFCPRCQPAV